MNFASAVLQEREKIHLSSLKDINYDQLLRLGTSAGGARAKAIIAYNEKTGDIRSGQIDYYEPGLCSYEMAALIGRRMGLPNIDIEQFYRRMVFNVLGVNQDDHVKNTSFLMDRNGVWLLAPAYDITFACDSGNKWLQAHQMTINGKNSNIQNDDMIICGENMSLKTSKCKKIIEEVENAVKVWHEIAETVGIRGKTIDLIKREIENKKL